MYLSIRGGLSEKDGGDTTHVTLDGELEHDRAERD